MERQGAAVLQQAEPAAAAGPGESSSARPRPAARPAARPARCVDAYVVVLCVQEHSAEGWELVRNQVRLHLLRVDLLAASVLHNN